MNALRIKELIEKNKTELQDRLDVGKEVACPFMYEVLNNHFICKNGCVIQEPMECILVARELKDNIHLYMNRCYYLLMPEQIIDIQHTITKSEKNNYN